MLYGLLLNRRPEDVVLGIVRGAVDAVRRFLCEALPCDLIGMNSVLMTRYIGAVADRLLTALGHSRFLARRTPSVGWSWSPCWGGPTSSRSVWANARRRAWWHHPEPGGGQGLPLGRSLLEGWCSACASSLGARYLWMMVPTPSARWVVLHLHRGRRCLIGGPLGWDAVVRFGVSGVQPTHVNSNVWGHPATNTVHPPQR